MKVLAVIRESECIGCKLCLPPCPVDCIDLISVPESHPRIPPEHVKQRYQARRQRLLAVDDREITAFEPTSIAERKHYIQEAVLRRRGQGST